MTIRAECRTTVSMSTNRVTIFDTTLRDGEQAPGISLGVKEKLEIAEQLCRLHVDTIEAGFPITSHGDFDAVKAIAEDVGAEPDAPVIAALARCARGDIDRAAAALNTRPGEVSGGIVARQEERKRLQRELQALRMTAAEADGVLLRHSAKARGAGDRRTRAVGTHQHAPRASRSIERPTASDLRTCRPGAILARRSRWSPLCSAITSRIRASASR